LTAAGAVFGAAAINAAATRMVLRTVGVEENPRYSVQSADSIVHLSLECRRDSIARRL
jgi:hypothetical protein